jgi:uncharacterized protein involved in outer membrane biogenesis
MLFHERRLVVDRASRTTTKRARTQGDSMRLNFLQQSLEDRASAALGLPVRCDDVTVSAVRGTLDAHNVTVGDADPPLLSIHRLRAELSAADTLEPRINIASLVLEAPVLHLSRGPDGAWNLPTRTRHGPKPAPHNNRITDDRWAFDCCSVQVVGGEIHVVVGLHTILATGVRANVVRGPEGIEITSAADSVALDGSPLGQARARVHFRGATDLASAASSPLAGELIHDAGRARFESASLATAPLHLAANGTIALSKIATLLPTFLIAAVASDARVRYTLGAQTTRAGKWTLTEFNAHLEPPPPHQN